MKELLIILFSSIFTVISGFHFYWILGGQLGAKVVFPTTTTTSTTKPPGKVLTFIAACMFLTVALFPLIEIKWLNIVVPKFIITYGYYMLLGVLVLRSIGDFKYFGLFKSIKNTSFAQYDKRYFTPLCILLSIIVLAIILLSIS